VFVWCIVYWLSVITCVVDRTVLRLWILPLCDAKSHNRRNDQRVPSSVNYVHWQENERQRKRDASPVMERRIARNRLAGSCCEIPAAQSPSGFDVDHGAIRSSSGDEYFSDLSAWSRIHAGLRRRVIISIPGSGVSYTPAVSTTAGSKPWMHLEVMKPMSGVQMTESCFFIVWRICRWHWSST
jgi:hypothetical protein